MGDTPPSQRCATGRFQISVIRESNSSSFTHSVCCCWASDSWAAGTFQQKQEEPQSCSQTDRLSAGSPSTAAAPLETKDVRNLSILNKSRCFLLCQQEYLTEHRVHCRFKLDQSHLRPLCPSDKHNSISFSPDGLSSHLQQTFLR